MYDLRAINQHVHYHSETLGMLAAYQEYRGVCISEASGIFPVGVAMCTHGC